MHRAKPKHRIEVAQRRYMQIGPQSKAAKQANKSAAKLATDGIRGSLFQLSVELPQIQTCQANDY